MLRTTNDPTKALNAVDEPTYIAPRTVEKQPQKRVALNGFLKRREMTPNVPENGTAPSREIVQRQRPAVMNVPMQQQKIGTNMMNNSPIVPAFDDVACAYIVASGK